MAYSSILDAILGDEGDNNGTKTASSTSLLGDHLLDMPSRHTFRATSAGARQAATGDTDLGEIASTFGTKEAGIEIPGLTIEQAVKFGARIVKVLTAKKLASPEAIRTALRSRDDIPGSLTRLTRLSNKTAAQMKQDGATKLADYLNPAIVPLWAKQANADLAAIQMIYAMVNAPKIEKTAATTDSVIKERCMSDADVVGHLKKLMTDGMTPADAEAKLTKMAELQLFSPGSLMTDKLRNDAAVVDYQFMEPNAYMDSTPSNYQRQDVKLGGIVDLKTAGQIRKWAGDLVSLASRENARPTVGIVKQAGHNVPFKRNPQDVTIRTAANRTIVKTASTFTDKDVLAMHNAGKGAAEIYRQAVTKVGSVKAEHMMRSFVAGLKGTKTKIALAQIDCTNLKGKLGTSNGIYGAPKCASCTYRKGMHCGLTGGTLLTYPGMENARSNHHIASGAPKDGMGMLKEFEMVKLGRMDDIDVGGIDRAEVEF